MAEHYHTNWVKDTKEFDQFFFKLCKQAFTHGSDEQKFAFMKRMIKLSRNKDIELSEMLAEGYQAKGDYPRAYIYSITANKPHMTCELLNDHLIAKGNPYEADLFKIRAVFEYLSITQLESAKV